MSTLYLPIPEEQEGRQALHFEPVCQVGLLINIYDCMIHWNSLCELDRAASSHDSFRCCKLGSPEEVNRTNLQA